MIKTSCLMGIGQLKGNADAVRTLYILLFVANDNESRGIIVIVTDLFLQHGQ